MDDSLPKTKGLTIGTREPTMGLRGIPETEVIFEDLEVAEDMVLNASRTDSSAASPS